MPPPAHLGTRVAVADSSSTPRPSLLTARMHACTGKMGTIMSVVAKLREVPGKAKTFKRKEFKAYRGGVLVVSLTR